MPIPQKLLDQHVRVIASMGMTHTNARLVVDTAHHAVNEAVATVGRITDALADDSHQIAATALALKWLIDAAEAEFKAVSDKYGDPTP